MNPSPTLVTTYGVASGEVRLSIYIGDGQIGDSIVRLELKDITPQDTAHIRKLPIGMGSALVGKQLHIKSIVSDVNDSTNHTTVQYVLEGGSADTSYTLNADVENAGDAIVYRATFTFIQS